MKVKREGLSKIAQEVLKEASMARSDLASRAVIVALRGDLGAGKTTFTQALARELGIEDAVQSPTYVLMKSYPINFEGFKKLIHIDAYRLDKPEEFSALAPDTFLHDSENLVVIEWPERVESVLPTPDLLLNFKHTDSEEERHIEIEK
ncbi:tRNA (adenosine(37)-N6)-threonylcarbamoyltransferase complex ATPase subunit type 1 TsaE [Patescibacteria group bacterium]|nr:tRNA (adenosine(37)-N6)-threonylcarbamoyltransferase complex ATPase subunit type 1 TsaE [Patescibacteria group bacterium]